MPDGTLTIDEVVSTNGTADVEVPVSTTALNNVGAVSLVINYDDAKLDYAGYTGNQISGWLFTQSAGQLSFSKVDGAGMTLTAGDLLTLKFDYNSSDMADINFTGGTFVQHTDLSVFQMDLDNGYIATAAEIDTQPESITVAEGDNASFSVSATGAISYQWQVNEGSGWNDISGETASTLTLTVLQEAWMVTNTNVLFSREM
ncbi:MAG: cohesin domain-containing protein [Bacteroidales bacterium]|nr:cohesin domain-containing protein [Bacteroidales bacterium]